jgi:MFS family permease
MTSGESHIRYEGWRVAAASGIGVFFASIVVYGFAVLLKPLVDDFGWSRQATSTAYSCFALASAVAAPVAGALLDRLGPLRIAVPCLIVCGLGVASLSALTASHLHLYVMFTALGLAATGTSPLAYSRAVATWFDERRGTALAVVIAGGALASMVHPPILDALIRATNWRVACLVMGAVLLVVGVPTVALFVRERQLRAGPSSAAIAGSTTPDAVRSWIFWTLIATVFGAAVAFNGVVVHLVALLTDRGIASGAAALALSLMGAAGLAGRLITGWLIDRFRATYVSAGLLALAAAGIVLLSSAPSLSTALLAAAMIGFGMGGELDVTPFLLSRYFGLRSLSTLYGLAWMAMGSGAAAGPVLMGRAFDAGGSYDRMLLQFAAATLAVALLMLCLPGDRLLIQEQPVPADLRD